VLARDALARAPAANRFRKAQSATRAFTTSDARFVSREFDHKPSNQITKKKEVCVFIYCFYNLEKVPGS